MDQAMTDGKDPTTGRFVQGNRFWESANLVGQPPTFASPEELRAACAGYFAWNDDNPLMAAELVKFEGQASVACVPKMRAMTLPALYMHIGISRRTWRGWRETKPEFTDVMDWAEDVIFRQKFEGAAADMLNASLIGRDLGLVDKQATEHTGNIGITRIVIEAATNDDSQDQTTA